MKNRLSCLLLAGMFSIMLSAAPRSEQQMLQIVRQFESVNRASNKLYSPSAPLVVASRSRAYCAINTNVGFVLVGADDRMPEVLGWSDRSRFAESSLPPAMVEWLKMYDEELRQSDSIAALHPDIVYAPQATNDVFDDQRYPMLSTEWAQGNPYNLRCPASSASEHCATGCVATAMAQVMKYWQYPVSGIGSNTYSWKCSDCSSGYKSSKTLSVNFYNTTYDWSQMLDTYQSDYTTTEANAVATLMYHCGVAANMTYGMSASSTELKDGALALSRHFGYGWDLELVEKDLLSAEDLMTIIHDDLSKGHPVLARGYDTQAGGHAFVCDGYTSSGYFHFNWGWSGTANGYFLLSAMNPVSLNTMFHFNTGVYFVTNIYPDSAQVSKPLTKMTTDGVVMYPKASTRNDSIYLQVHELRFRGNGPFPCRIGIGVYDSLNAPICLLWQSDTVTLPGYRWGWTLYRTAKCSLPDTLSDGTYYLDVVCKREEDGAEWTRVTYNYGASGPIRIDLRGNAQSIVEPNQPITDYTDVPYVLMADTFTTTHIAYARKDTLFVTMQGLKNNSDTDFYGYHDLGLYDSDGHLVSVLAASTGVKSVHAGHSVGSVKYRVILNSSMPAGTYLLQPIYKGTIGDWQPILHSSDSTAITRVIHISKYSVLFDGLRLTKPIVVDEGKDTVSTSGFNLNLSVPFNMKDFKLMLAMVFGNVLNEKTYIIQDDVPYDFGAGDWYWSVSGDQIQQMLTDGTLVREGANTLKLMWKMDVNDTFAICIPTEYSNCSFYLQDVSLPADGATLSCAEAASIAANLTHNVPMTQTYTVVGWVTEMLYNGISRGQQRFMMSDSPNETAVFQCYWGNVAEEILIGDYVALTGHLQRYNDIPEIVNGNVTLLNRPNAIGYQCADDVNWNSPYYVYTLQGVHIADDIHLLPAGVYIIRQANTIAKIIK